MKRNLTRRRPPEANCDWRDSGTDLVPKCDRLINARTLTTIPEHQPRCQQTFLAATNGNSHLPSWGCASLQQRGSCLFSSWSVVSHFANSPPRLSIDLLTHYPPCQPTFRTTRNESWGMIRRVKGTKGGHNRYIPIRRGTSHTTHR